MTLQKHRENIDIHKPTKTFSDFQLPSKDLQIVPIVAPPRGPTSPLISDATRSQNQPYPSSPPSVSDHSSCPTTLNVEQRDATNITDNALKSDTVFYNNNPYLLNSQQTPTASSSTLDIFTPSYVPLRLRAVNQSIADLQPCAKFPAIDFFSYVAAFVGPDFVQPVETAVVPPPVHIPNGESSLHGNNYSRYWHDRLQNEFALQQKLSESFSIYDQQLRPAPGGDNLYIVHVPGLREHAPRVDIGDTVHVRPLIPGHMISEVSIMWWLEYGKYQGSICPGFTGLLYNPCVWGIDRAKEHILLRIDSFNLVQNCNIIFLLQESKLEPGCRAIGAPIDSNPWLRCTLFPEVDDGVLQTTLSKGNFDIAWIDSLNWEQKKAVHTIISKNYGSMPYLISGPPGTGKTKTIVETALQLIRQPGHLLICAPSDAAADTLALRLSLHLEPSELFRLNSWTRTFAEVPDRLLLYTYSNNAVFSLPPVQQMLSFKIIVTTCRDADMLHHARLTNISLYRLFNGIQPLLNPGAEPVPLHWTALLLDEAAQATEPEAMIALSVVMPPEGARFPQFVAAGDQYQLGPKLLSRSGLEISLFERLFARNAYSAHPLSRKNGTARMTSKLLPVKRPAFCNLIRNYRSHPAILSVPSSLFYDDTLITERKSSQDILTWPGWRSESNWPVLFQQNDSLDAYESVTDGDGTGYGSLYNPGEAIFAVDTVRSLLNHMNRNERSGLSQRDIMIMSPFRAQVTQLRKHFRRAAMFEVNIGPLEAFQGLEARIVIICTTRTRTGSRPHRADHYVNIDKHRSLGLIDEPQRLNVALTRAQEGLIVIGNVPCLICTNDNQWLNFLDFCKRNECFAAPSHFKWPILEGNFQQGRLEKALKYAELETQRHEEDHDHHDDTSELTSHPHSRFSLKGVKQDMDEEMWQLKELAQSYDLEDIDLVLDAYQTVDTSETAVRESREESHPEESSSYDRDLQQDFRDECTTQ